jgi:hypothetical protein
MCVFVLLVLDAHAQTVKILTPFIKKVSIAEVKITFGAGDPRLALYPQSRTRPILHALTIPFNIPIPPAGAELKVLSVNLLFFTPQLYHDDGVRIISSIPLSVDVASQITTSVDIIAKLSSANVDLEGKISSREQFEKLYRTVEVHHFSDNEISWRFVPGGQQEVLPGIYTVVALIEANPLPHLAYIDGGCSFQYGWLRGKKIEHCTPVKNVKFHFQ